MEVRKVLKPPETGRGKKRLSPGDFRREHSSAETEHKPASFKLLASRMVRKQISIVLSQAVCGICYSSPRKLILPPT